MGPVSLGRVGMPEIESSGVLVRLVALIDAIMSIKTHMPTQELYISSQICYVLFGKVCIPDIALFWFL